MLNICSIGIQIPDSKSRVMPIFEDGIFPQWNHLFLCYPCNADFKTALVFKIGPILVVYINFNHPKSYVEISLDS